MIKLFSLIPLVLLNIGCSSEVAPEHVNAIDSKPEQVVIEQATSNALREGVALAVQENDYRLFVTSGRSKSIPGVSASDYQRVIELCGEKYMPATGDVLTSEKQRLARKQAVDYMKGYNKEMLTLCQNKFL